MKRYILTLACSLFSFFGIAQNVDWTSFMEKQALNWNTLGKNYYEGALLGNGLLGINLYSTTSNVLRFDIGRKDVIDNRDKLYPNVNKLFNQARLPIGHFDLKTIGTITDARLRLDIYNAKLMGKVVTDSGTIEISAYVSAVQNVMVIEFQKTRNERSSQLIFKPGRSISPRYLQDYVQNKPNDYPDNPPFKVLSEDKFTVYHQPLLNGGGYATAFKIDKNARREQILIGIGYDGDNSTDEVSAAKQDIRSFEQLDDARNETNHRKWWNQYFKKSFVSVPDRRTESFYWIQLYKLACLTRADKPIIDLMGPWTNTTPWPAIWWNLNTQLTYSPLFTINHAELSKPLWASFEINKQNLIANVPQQWQSDAAAIGRTSSYDLVSKITDKEIANGSFEPANLTWTLYYFYQYYLHNKDQSVLRNQLFPLLKRSANFLIRILEKDDKGVYHVRNSFSPEYKSAIDANYTLSTLKWALTTLIELNKELRLKDQQQANWEMILENLAPFPQDETGFTIGKDVPLTSSHRHYSHLLMIYPYHLINWENKSDRPIIKRSLEHWISLKGALQGYTFTGAASIYATMGDGNSAFNMLNQLFEKYIQPNTLYRESGPVIETPLAAVASITELLMQDWNGKIRIFPAVPDAWENVSFDNLSASGAFEIGAKRENSKTTYIKVTSKAGGECVLQTDLKPNKVEDEMHQTIPFKVISSEGKNTITFQMHKGQTIEIKSQTATNETIIPVTYTQNSSWRWGLN